MRKIRIKPWLLAAGAAVALSMGVAAPSQADALQQFKFVDVGSDPIVHFTNGGPDVYVGRYNATLNGNSINIFCTDFTHDINFGQTYDTLVTLGTLTDAAVLPVFQETNAKYYYENTITIPNPNPGPPLITVGIGGGGMASAIVSPQDYNANNLSTALTAAQRASEVAYLTDKYLNASLPNVNDYAGVQLAIWNIIQDGEKVTDSASADAAMVSIAGRTLDTTGTTATITNLAAQYLLEASGFNSYKTGPATTAYWIQSGSNGTNGDYRSNDHPQDFAYSIGAPIPEPAFYQLSVLLGMGALGSLRLLKRKRIS